MTQNLDRREDFLSKYLQYTSKTESPTFFHRWSALTSLAAWIGRDIYLPFGHTNIHANMYVMLVGLAGTKKSTAIKISANLLKDAGFTDFAAKKTRQEKFLIDLAEQGQETDEEGMSMDDILDQNLFGESNTDASMKPPAEVFAAADEVNNFIGTGNLDFMSILGELWDFEGVFDYKLKNSKSVFINNPTISILGGNTFVGFNKLFPPEAQEQGFFSRTLFVYAEPIGRKYVIPPPPDPALKQELIEHLLEIKKNVRGEMTLTQEAYDTLEVIYHSWQGMDDSRFDSYENRRDGHLLKIAMVLAASRITTVIDKEDIVYANTILSFTEQYMPKALGEFGKSRNSSISHKVMALFDAHPATPLTFKAIFKAVHNDVESRNQLIEILVGLKMAEKIQDVRTDAGEGYLPIKKAREDAVTGTVDNSYLTPSELGD